MKKAFQVYLINFFNSIQYFALSNKKTFIFATIIFYFLNTLKLMLNFLLFILIGAVAGWLAGIILKGKGFGIVLNLVIGIIGSFLGGWLFGILGISFLGIIGELVAAVVGAIILLWIISVIKKK